jgi:hypothetical protein
MKSLLDLFKQFTPDEHFGAIKIGMASPEKIRSWSFGEVRKPETIQDLVLADRELGLDLHAQVVLDRRHLLDRAGRLHHRRRDGVVRVVLRRARVLLPVLDQARRAHLIDLREDVLVQGLHVGLLQDHRHRHHHREVGRRPLVVVGHRQDGPGALTHQHHLGGVVEQLGPAAADVEAAEGVGGRGRGEAGGGEGRGEGEDETFAHGTPGAHVGLAAACRASLRGVRVAR